MKTPFLNQHQRFMVRLNTASGATYILSLRINQFAREVKRSFLTHKPQHYVKI